MLVGRQPNGYFSILVVFHLSSILLFCLFLLCFEDPSKEDETHNNWRGITFKLKGSFDSIVVFHYLSCMIFIIKLPSWLYFEVLLYFGSLTFQLKRNLGVKVEKMRRILHKVREKPRHKPRAYVPRLIGKKKPRLQLWAPDLQLRPRLTGKKDRS